jgi:hypothetical protein
LGNSALCLSEGIAIIRSKLFQCNQSWQIECPPVANHTIDINENGVTVQSAAGARYSRLCAGSGVSRIARIGKGDLRGLSSCRESVLRKMDGAVEGGQATIILGANVLLYKNLSVFL